MKRLLFAILLLAGCARADELQLDHSFGVTSASHGLAFSPDASKLAVVGSDGVKIYETASGRVLETRAASGFLTCSVAWSPDGKSLAAGGRSLTSTRSGDIWIWNAGQKPLHWITGKAAIEALAWSPDGRTLASAGGTSMFEDGVISGTACLWNAADGKLKRTLGSYEASYSSIGFSADGKVVAFSGTPSRGEDGGYLTLCDAQSGRVLKTWDKGVEQVLFHGQSPIFEDALMAREVKDGFEYEIKVSIASKAQTFFIARKIGAKQNLTRMPLDDAGMGATIGGDYVAEPVYVRSNHGLSSTLALWKISGNPPRATLVRRIGGRTIAAAQLAVSGDGKTFALACSGGTALFDANFAQPRIVASRSPSELVAASPPKLSLSWDGSRLYDGRWWDLKSAVPTEVLPSLQVSNAFQGPAALSPDGQILAGTNLGVLGTSLFRVAKTPVNLAFPVGEQIPGDFLMTTGVSWSADSKHLVLIVHNAPLGQLSLFNNLGKFERVLGSAEYSMQWDDVAFSPDDRHIASVGYSVPDSKNNRTEFLNVWNSATTQQEHQIKVLQNVFGPKGPSCCLAFSPDSHTLAVSGTNPAGQKLFFFDFMSGAEIGVLPLRSIPEKSWVFLDSGRVAILNGNAIEVWDFRAHRLEKSEFMVPKPGGFSFVERH